MDLSLFFSLLLLGLLACASCETCPPPEDIAPCACVPNTWSSGKINVECDGVNQKEMEDAFDNLRGKTIDELYLKNVKGDRLSSFLFWNTRVRWIQILSCDLQALSDSDRRPAFLGLENSLESLSILSCIKGGNQLKTLDLSHLKKLNYLWLSGNNIPEVGNDWFAKGPLSLTFIRIIENGLSKLGDRAFVPLANLQDLNLSENRLTYIDIDRLVFQNPVSHLETLDLSYNNLTSLQDDIFSGMPSLRTVRLKKNSIKRIEEKTWSSVWETLDYLYLDGNPLECAYNMKWMFSLKPPKVLTGTCDSPASVKGESLSEVIEKNRKLLSLI